MVGGEPDRGVQRGRGSRTSCGGIDAAGTGASLHGGYRRGSSEGGVMFENCHSPFEVAHVYRGMGFPVSCRFGRVAVTASRSLGAVVMPPDLGAVVRHELEHDQGITASVLTYHRPRRDWVFVVGSGSGGALG